MATVSGSERPWRRWSGDENKSLQKIFKDRLMFGDMESAELISKMLKKHEIEGMGTKLYNKFLRVNPLRSAEIAKVCGMAKLQVSAVNEWYDSTVEKDGKPDVRTGTTRIAFIFGASNGRVESAAIKEARNEFEKGNWHYSVDLLKMVGMNPKGVLRSLADDGFNKAVRDGNEIMAKFIADEVLDLKCGMTINIPARTEE